MVDAQGYFEKRDALSQDWTTFLEQISVIPLLIPNKLSNISLFLEENHVDGIILSGGDNIGDNYERDHTEKELIEFGIKKRIPIFGVCRGMQVLNKFFQGGITSDPENIHVGNKHEVKITNDEISKVLKKNTIIVNSFHYNIINANNMGESFFSFAIDERDRTIEGFMHKNLPVMGVMWHPERDRNQENQLLLNNFLRRGVSIL